jgi:hypothetical protein
VNIYQSWQVADGQVTRISRHDDVKERIVEYLAVRKLRADARSTDIAHPVRAHNDVPNVHAIAGAGRSERHVGVRSNRRTAAC